MRRLMTIAALVVSTSLLQGCFVFFGGAPFKAQTELKKSLEPMRGSVVVDTRNGRIDVVAEERPDVSIEATLTCGGASHKEADERLAATALSCEVDQAGNLVVKPVFPGGPRNGDGASIWIRLPGAAGGNLRTSNGPVTSRGLSGELTIDTSNGRIEIVQHGGSARLDTSNGSIVARKVAGSLWADTSNGGVRVEEVAGPITVDTSNGSIVAELDGTHAGPLDLDTSNGSITVRVGGAFTGAVHLSTSNGGIRVHDPHGRIRSQTLSRNRGEILVGGSGEPGAAGASHFDTSNGSIDFTIEG